MESPDVISKRILPFHIVAPVHDAAVYPSSHEGKGSARVRQNNVEFGELVQRAGDDHLRRRRFSFKWKAKRVVQVGRSGGRGSQPGLPSAEDVFVAVERVKQQR